MPIDDKPSRNEDEYFAKQDAELMRVRRLKLDAERAKQDRTQHYNKCPKCGCDLVERAYHNVRIDACPECKGMWLDAGELEMIQHVDRNSLSRFLVDMLGMKPR